MNDTSLTERSLSINSSRDLVSASSPRQKLQEIKDRDQSAHESLIYRLKTTDYLPKEYEIRRAYDEDFDRAERHAGKLALTEALDRMSAWERAWRDIYQYGFVYAAATRARWQESWNETSIKKSLGGTTASIYTTPEYSDAYQKYLKAEKKHTKDKSVRSANHLDSTIRKLETLRPANTLRKEQGGHDFAILLKKISDVNVTPQDTASVVSDFLRRYEIIDKNLINKLSEIVTAKAVWFDSINPLELFPGPDAIGTSDSPDYIGRREVGDNFRIDGISMGLHQIVRNPKPEEHSSRKTAILNAIKKGIADKFNTYFTKRLKNKRERLVVTVDITAAPWALRDAQELVRQSVARLNSADRLAAQPIEVYFIVDGRAHLVWH